MHTKNSRVAVVLFNMGGPDSPEAVEPFLYNLFSDPLIVEMPFRKLFQKRIARRIARKRSEWVRKAYEKIGGKSPVNYWTEVQRQKLEERLRRRGVEADVFTAMRYWRPLIREAARLVRDGGYRELVLLPLYPQYSQVTTATSLLEWDRVFGADGIIQHRVREFYAHPAYLKAMSARIEQALKQFPESLQTKVELLFSAHGVPERIIRRGDPYRRQIEESVRLLMALRQEERPWHLAFQSRATPVKWIQPDIGDMLVELGKQGKEALLVVPISFVSDHLETLYELDIQYRELAESAGIRHYRVMQGLNGSDEFISALEAIVLDTLERKS